MRARVRTCPGSQMDVVLQIGMLVGGLAIAIAASDVAVGYARALAAALGASPFIVGVVIVGVGTDLPEIANSIAAHLQREGDVNVGDSVGSALTQDTFVLALFPLIVAMIAIARRQVGLVTALTVGGLVLTALLVSDGELGRVDGIVLISSWVVAVVLVTRFGAEASVDTPPDVRVHGALQRGLVVLASLLAVGFGATVAVRALIDLAEQVGVPTFLLAFFGASMGTSAPEIVVVITALMRGAPAIALGDALGSSLADSTLSIGAGPVVRPAEVTTHLAVGASLYTAAAVSIVGALLVWRRRHDRVSAGVFFALYVLSYFVLIALN